MRKEHPKGWNGKSRGGGFGYSFFVLLIRHCGLRGAYTFLAFVVIYFIPCAPKATAAVWDYYRQRRGIGRIRAVWKLYLHYYRFGQTLIDKVAIGAGMADRFHFDFDNYEEFLGILQSGSGVVMIGAHVGCWEAGAHFFGEYGKRINIVMFDAEYARIREVVERNTAARNYKIIPINGPTLDTMLQIKVALNRGEYVCFQGDRYLTREHATPASFLGGSALFPEGPFLLASRLRVPVVFYYAMRERGRRYRFLFTAVRPEEKCSQEQILQRYTRSLEEVLGRYPEQWYNLYKFWA